MCTYIYFTLPDYAEVRQLHPPMQAVGLRFHETSHRVIEGLLKDDEVLYGATGTGCDCDTWLGSLPVVEPASDQVEARREYHEHRAACRKCAQDWIRAFRSAVEARATDRIGLLLWWEGGGAAPLGPRVRVPLEEVDVDLLGRMEHQRIYEFHGTPPPQEF